MKILYVIVLFLGLSANACAEFISVAPEYEQRYEKLLSELRCLVCQNQTVAESSSDLANDLRLEVKEMLEQGKSDQDILTFMSDRYGDFVLYNPPVKARTYLLWVGPFVLLLGGVIGVILMVRKRAQFVPESELNEQEKQRLKSLLNDNKENQ